MYIKIMPFKDLLDCLDSSRGKVRINAEEYITEKEYDIGMEAGNGQWLECFTEDEIDHKYLDSDDEFFVETETFRYITKHAVLETSETLPTTAFNIINTPKENTMKNTASDLLIANKTNTIAVARVTAGKALNKKIIQLIKPKVPILIRGYLDSGLTPVITANAVAFAIKQYTNSPKANEVADIMLEAAAFQAAEAFNLDDILEDLLDGITLPEGNTPDISNMSMTELRAYAKSNNIDISEVATGKPALRDFILEQL